MRKVRYHLGPGGTMYIVATSMILAGAINTQANLLFWAFGLTTGALVMSMCCSLVSLRRLTVERLAPSQGVMGEPLSIRYRFVNASRLPVWGLLIEERWDGGGRWWSRRRRKQAIERGDIPTNDPTTGASPQMARRPLGWVLHLGPRQTGQGEAICWPLRRGKLVFDRVVVSTSFPFGVIRKSITVRRTDEVLIYPRLFRMNRRVLGRASGIEPGGRNQIDRAGGREDFFGLRHYRIGDSLKMIDWKHSAKAAQLITREMTLPSPPRIMLALDLRPETLKAAEAAPANHAAGGASRAAPSGNGNGTRDADDVATGSPAGHDAALHDQSDPFELAICLAASMICDSHLQGYEIGMVVWGVECHVFRMHHSLPHRTKMLEALSGLDRRRQADPQPKTAMMIAEPTVIVRPGASVGRGGVFEGRIVLGTDDIDHLVKELDADIVALMTHRGTPARREGAVVA